MGAKAVSVSELVAFIGDARLPDVCARLGVAAGGTASAQRARVVRAAGADLGKLLPLVHRAELVAFLAAPRDGGHFHDVNRASRDDLLRLVEMVCAGDPRARVAQPLGAASPIRYEAPTRSAGPRVTEKVHRTGVARASHLMYYVKDGDVWAVPRPRRGKPAKKPETRLVRAVGIPVDNKTYLYFLDNDGDIARRRRDGKPIVPEGAPPPAAPPPGVHGRPLRVFVSYARTDIRFLEELVAFVDPYQRSRALEIFVDSRIGAGAPWEEEIEAQLAQADIFIMLLTSQFLRSDWCMDRELPAAMARHRRGECELVPILVRACRYDLTPIGRYNVIRPGDKAVDDHERHDPAWVEVTRALDDVIARMKK